MNSKRETQKKISNMTQLAGIKDYEIRSGKAKGTGVLEVYNQAGLNFSVLPDQCLDIYELKYKGQNIGFPSKNGLHGNAFFNGLDNEFIYFWRAGMVYTCGLATTGPPNTDDGLYRMEHGRIGHTPAENIRAFSGWKDGKYILSIDGDMTETIICGSNLRLSRHLETELNSKEIMICDKVENLQPADEEFMLLYHVNFGYPIVDEGTRLVKGKGNVKPRFEDSSEGLDVWDQATDPLDEFPEQCFFHENTADKDGFAYLGIINDKLGIGAYVKYSLDTLPIALEWKNMLSHDYTIALEPGNSYLMGREEERKNGTLPVIKGYSEINHCVTLGILEGEEIADFEKMLSGL